MMVNDFILAHPIKRWHNSDLRRNKSQTCSQL
nr:MAG TPA: hypothetical protein [Bacteriophage sp.]